MKTLERPLHDYMAEVSERTEVRTGVPLPMEAHEYGGGVNFAFFSRHASRVRLEFFALPLDSTLEGRSAILLACKQEPLSGEVSV